ncbi:MAG: hypothetical protein IPG18_04750 [Saprospiraceae bacterium]|nr:hypothetical protein [Saprospiraceae bacterium]
MGILAGLINYILTFGRWVKQTFFCGSNASLQPDFPVKYRSKGLSLYYSKCGKLDYWKTITSIRYHKVIKEAKDLPVEKYDLIINDFEHITSRSCQIKKYLLFNLDIRPVSSVKIHQDLLQEVL